MQPVNDNHRPCTALVVLQRDAACEWQAAAGASLHRLNVVNATAGHDGDIVGFINPGDHLEQLILGVFTLKIDADSSLESGIRNIIELKVVAKNLICNFGHIGFFEIEDNLLSFFIRQHKPLVLARSGGAEKPVLT